MLKGKLTALTAVERADLRQLLDWRNNPDFRRHFREYRELSYSQQEQWFEEKVLNDPTTMMFAVRKLNDGDLIGCCGFVYINWVHRHADLSLYIGWKDAYIDTRGFAEDCTRTLLQYGFGELGLHKVWTEIYEFDDKKRKLYDTFGFHLDGVLRDNYFHEGKFWNSHILSLLDNEFLDNRRKAPKS